MLIKSKTENPAVNFQLILSQFSGLNRASLHGSKGSNLTLVRGWAEWTGQQNACLNSKCEMVPVLTPVFLLSMMKYEYVHASRHESQLQIKTI